MFRCSKDNNLSNHLCPLIPKEFPKGQSPKTEDKSFETPGNIIGCNIMSLQRDFIGNFIDRTVFVKETTVWLRFLGLLWWVIFWSLIFGFTYLKGSWKIFLGWEEAFSRRGFLTNPRFVGCQCDSVLLERTELEGSWNDLVFLGLFLFAWVFAMGLLLFFFVFLRCQALGDISDISD